MMGIVDRYYLVICIFLFTSCNHFSTISICSNLQEGDSISVAMFLKNENQYVPVNKAIVTREDVKRNIITLTIPGEDLRQTQALAFTVQCYSDSVFTLSSIILKNFGIIYPKDIQNTLWWQEGLNFEYDPINKILTSSIKKRIPSTFPVGFSLFYHSRPIGLQFFLRLSFLASLIILLFFFTKQTPTQRFLLFTIALFLTSLPLKMDWSNWTLGLMGLISIVTFIANKERKFRWQPIYWIPMTIYALYLLGCLYAEYKDDAYRELDSSVSLIIFPILFSIICLTKENIALLLRFFIRAIMIFCIFGLLSYATIIPDFNWDIAFRDGKLYAPLLLMWPAFPHPSITAMILAMAAPIAIYLRYHEKNISSIEMLLCLLLMIIFPMLTGARVAMIIVPIIIGLGFLIYGKIKPVFKWVMIGIAIAGCVFALHRYPELKTKFSDPIREQLRASAIDGIKQKPWFGWGTGGMQQVNGSAETAVRLGYETALPPGHSHNMFLDMAVQFGIPGILLILGLFGGCLFLAFKYKDFLLLSFVIIYLIFMMVESPFATVKGIQPFMFWFCFLIATQKVRLNTQSNRF